MEGYFVETLFKLLRYLPFIWLIYILVIRPLERKFGFKRYEDEKSRWLEVKFFFALLLFDQFVVVPAVVSFREFALMGVIPRVPWKEIMNEAPWLVQIILMLFFVDFFYYWYHRLSHNFKPLWLFHSCHHTLEHTTMVSTYRLHFLSVLVGRVVIGAILYLGGFDIKLIGIYAVIATFLSTFGHMNINMKLGPLEGLIATPHYHHWHHAKGASRSNYALVFPWIDRFFGTYNAPKEFPTEMGIRGKPNTAHSLWSLQVQPFQEIWKDIKKKRLQLLSSRKSEGTISK